MWAALGAALLWASAWPICAAVAPEPSRLRAAAEQPAGHLLEGQIAFDTEATVLDFSAVSSGPLLGGAGGGLADRFARVLDGAAHKAGLDWSAWNPKNGTPWYRFKRVGDRGEAGHPHFGGLTSTGDFTADMVAAHNAVRSNAGLPPVEWKGELAMLASSRVRTLVGGGCYIRHSPLEHRWQKAGFTYVGENLYKVINMAPTGVDIVDAWYAEVVDYNYGPVGAQCTKAKCAGRASPPCTLGHFTQVMWARTSHLGCAMAECPDQPKRTFVAVCNYGPGGNIVGRLPFDAAHAGNLGLGAQACTSPNVSPFSLKHNRTAALRSAATHRGGTGAALLLAAGLTGLAGLQ